MSEAQLGYSELGYSEIGGPIPSGIIILTDKLPAGSFGAPYSAQLEANKLATWTITSGSLPPGLSLDSQTGLISGTPNVEGMFAFTVKATSSTGASDTASYTVQIGQQQGRARIMIYTC